MTRLTKGRFLSGLQCPKRLWLDVHAPLPDTTDISAQVLQGRKVDAFVQRLQPGVVISREQGMPAAIAATTALRQSGMPERLYQPAFQVGDLAVIADMVETYDGSVTLTEVKAATAVKPEHLPDVGFQALVMRHAGLPVDRMQLLHLDPTFVLQRPGDYEGLLHAADVTMQVEEALPEIEQASHQSLGVLNQPGAPQVRTGEHCFAPWECPHRARCVREEGGGPEFPVEMLPRGGKLAIMLKGEGHTDLRTVSEDRLTSELHRRVHRVTLTGIPFLDRGAAEAVSSLPYPISYLDFETVAPAIPEVVGTRPYQNLPFQFSVHVESGPDDLRHAEFLADRLPVDLTDLARALVAAIPADGAILAYNAGFERMVLLDLAKRVPAWSRALESLAQRLVDLLPITRKAYYHPAMKGSWSFKAVLPTIDASLDYKALPGVQDGQSAQVAFLEMSDPDTPCDRRETLRQQLLSYCERDTYGMVVLRKFFCQGSP